MSKYTPIARIARRFPKTIHRVRYFKHLYKLINFNGPISKVNSLMEYVCRASVANRNNARWALMADKYGVRSEVEKLIGKEHLIPLYGHWENPEDIDFDALPQEYILKTNNGCGTNIIVRPGKQIDRENIKLQLRKALDFPYSELSGQLHYSLIPPAVIAEKLMDQGNGQKSLIDYKVHCVNGEPRIVYVFSDRDEINHFDFNVKPYTLKWQEIPHFTSPADLPEDAPVAPNKPAGFDKMIDLARKLSAGEEYVRVDFYIIDGVIYFGEMTYTPDVGYNKFFRPYMRVMDYILNCIRTDREKGVSSETF